MVKVDYSALVAVNLGYKHPYIDELGGVTLTCVICVDYHCGGG